jgi:hypothetical protein
MGVLLHGPLELEVDDRVLTHMEIIIVNKLRRHESFLLSWLEDASSDTGRNALWLSAGHPVHFRYGTGRASTIDKDWLRILEVGANGPRGLVAVDAEGKPVRLRSRT